ncbi:MAG: Crp/Fnr family transcriptional regulator, partial [Alphaproteobacteria bacterium]|nr:Crp/Fnr family transcriptional regulator [Alphaproteobacteria bacterium]
ASRVSTTRETVARVFGDLAQQGIIHREGDALRVGDLQKLEEMVLQFCSE